MTRPEPLSPAESMDDLFAAYEKACEEDSAMWRVEFRRRIEAKVIDRERVTTDRLRAAIDAALHELGVPGEGYPQPIVNAVDILSAALEDHHAD